MRKRLAQALAVAAGLIIVTVAVVFAFRQNVGAGVGAQAPDAPDQAAIERGIEVYAEQGCRACHAIEGEGNPRYPLDGVGSRLTLEQIRGWIVSPQEMDPRVRKPAYDQLPEAELDALIAYLASLTDEP